MARFCSAPADDPTRICVTCQELPSMYSTTHQQFLDALLDLVAVPEGSEFDTLYEEKNAIYNQLGSRLRFLDQAKTHFLAENRCPGLDKIADELWSPDFPAFIEEFFSH